MRAVCRGKENLVFEDKWLARELRLGPWIECLEQVFHSAAVVIILQRLISVSFLNLIMDEKRRK